MATHVRPPNKSTLGGIIGAIPPAERMLSLSMTNMSVAERSQVYEDINCVPTPIEETEKLLTNSLEELQRCLETTSPGTRADSNDDNAYWQARKRHDSSYITSRDFHLMFLRAERFDVPKAAALMIKFFEKKLDLWGSDALTRRITLADLSEAERKIYKRHKAGIQVVPRRDMAGRAVLFSNEKENQKHKHNLLDCNSFERLIWYFVMSVLEDDPITQKNGAVYIIYAFGCKLQQGENEKKLFLSGLEIANSTPLRISATHFCYDKLFLKPFVDLLAFGLNTYSRCRFKIKHGTHTECEYWLLTFGLPVDVFPIRDDLTMKTKEQKEWLRRREIREGEPDYFRDKIELPGLNDVLCASGKPYRQYPATAAYRNYVESCYDEYKKKPDAEKMEYIKRMIEYMKREKNWRFLRLVVGTVGSWKVDSKDRFWEVKPDDELVCMIQRRLTR